MLLSAWALPLPTLGMAATAEDMAVDVVMAGDAATAVMATARDQPMLTLAMAMAADTAVDMAVVIA